MSNKLELIKDRKRLLRYTLYLLPPAVLAGAASGMAGALYDMPWIGALIFLAVLLMPKLFSGRGRGTNAVVFGSVVSASFVTLGPAYDIDSPLVSGAIGATVGVAISFLPRLLSFPAIAAAVSWATAAFVVQHSQWQQSSYSNTNEDAVLTPILFFSVAIAIGVLIAMLFDRIGRHFN